MKMKTLVFLTGSMLISNVWGIDVAQLSSLCRSSEYAQQQFCNTYIGGALDAIAVMNDRARAQGTPLYCLHETVIFDFSKIKSNILSLEEKWQDKNAVLPVVEYLQKVGGCKIKEDN